MITSGLENLHKKREKESKFHKKVGCSAFMLMFLTSCMEREKERRELKIALKRKENSQKEKGEYIMEYLIRVDCICRSFCNQNSTF